MVLPSLSAPTVFRDRAACISWMGLAYVTVAEHLQNYRRFSVEFTPPAEELITSLREFLFYAWRSEHQKRRDPHRREVCYQRTWFCYFKYEEARRELMWDGPARQKILLQVETLSPLYAAPV